MPDCKAWSEAVVVSTKYVYKLPQEMSFKDAAAMLMNYVVAYGLVFDTACVRQGQTVLIHSAGGGVVSFFGLLAFIFFVFSFMNMLLISCE